MMKERRNPRHSAVLSMARGKRQRGLKKTKNGFFSYPLLANSELLLKCFKLLHLIDDRYKSAFLNSGLMTAVQGKSSESVIKREWESLFSDICNSQC